MNVVPLDFPRSPPPASAPKRGRSVAGAVAPIARDMLEAVAMLRNISSNFKCSWLEESGRDRLSESPQARRAWAVATVGVLHAIASGKSVDLTAAVAWFEGVQPAGKSTPGLVAAGRVLDGVASAPQIEALLPYVLDAFGPTSRLDVMRDGTRKADRTARKDVGSFYTPSDVADFMVLSISGSDPEAAAWLDPACGSGAFLVAVLRLVRKRGLKGEGLVRFATSHLFGLDLSALATDFAAFSVVHNLLHDLDVAPAKVWAAVRSNLIAVDALQVCERDREVEGGLSLTTLFGALPGPLRLLCNPPYAASIDSRHARNWASLRSDRPGGSLFLPFVEMAWRLDGRPGDAAALVVPLSIGTSRTADHVRCRSAMVEGGGHWSMLFFDRQPHALFGEDAKTRNAILVRRQSEGFELRTSRLLRWTSRQRESIFTEERSIPLPAGNIRRLVPKVGSALEASLYETLTTYRLRSVERPHHNSVALAGIASTVTPGDVYVSGTAYNFLNVFRRYPDPRQFGGAFSESKVQRLTFRGADEAEVAYALLSSRVAFWLWHVECDGFHVPAWFLDELPLLDLQFEPLAKAELARLGREMWKLAKDDLYASLNGGKWTFAFRPTLAATERAAVDGIILDNLGISRDHLDALTSFHDAVVSIDGQKRSMPSGEYDKMIKGMI